MESFPSLPDHKDEVHFRLGHKTQVDLRFTIHGAWFDMGSS